MNKEVQIVIFARIMKTLMLHNGDPFSIVLHSHNVQIRNLKLPEISTATYLS